MQLTKKNDGKYNLIKGILMTLLMGIAMIIFFSPKEAKADYLGKLTKDNPCVYKTITLKEYAWSLSFDVSVQATDVKFYLKNKNGKNSSVTAELANDSGTIKTLKQKKGKTTVSSDCPDLNENETYYIFLDPKLSGIDEMTIELCIYSEGLGGKNHDFSKIALNKSRAELTQGETIKLKADVDKNLKKSGVVWTSSDKKVATVNKKGKVKTKSEGKVLITCYSKKDKKYSAQCFIWVYAKPETDKEPDKTDIEKDPDNSVINLDSELRGKFEKVLKGTEASTTSYLRNYPCVTCTNGGTSNTRDKLIDGTYDFKNDPDGVVIGWYMYDNHTSKEDLEKLFNSSITDSMYQTLTAYYTSYVYVIVYGKNSDGILSARYAGFIKINTAASGTKSYSYSIYGIAEDNTNNYGKLFSGSC